MKKLGYDFQKAKKKATLKKNLQGMKASKRKLMMARLQKRREQNEDTDISDVEELEDVDDSDSELDYDDSEE